MKTRWFYLLICLCWYNTLHSQGGYSTNTDPEIIKLTKSFTGLLANNNDENKKLFVLNDEDVDLDGVELNLKKSGNDANVIQSNFATTLNEINSFLAEFNENNETYEVYVYIRRDNDVNQSNIIDAGSQELPDQFIENIPNFAENTNKGSNAYFLASKNYLDLISKELLLSSTKFKTNKIRVLIAISNLQFIRKIFETERNVIEVATLFSAYYLPVNGSVTPCSNRFKQVVKEKITEHVASPKEAKQITVVSCENLDDISKEYILDDIALNKISEKFLNSDQKSVSFISPTGKIVSLPYDSIKSVQFSYGDLVSFEDELLFQNENFCGGILVAFQIKNGEEPLDFIYNTSIKSYRNNLSEDYIDVFSIDDVDGFLFPFACSGSYMLYKFNRSNLEKYVSGSGNILLYNFPELTSIFQPFSSEFSLAVDYAQEFSPFSFNLNSEELLLNQYITNSHCRNEEIIYLDKIFQVASAHIGWYKEYVGHPYGIFEVKESSPWGVFLEDNPNYKSLNGTNNPEFANIFLINFRLFIDEKSNFWETYSETVPNSALDAHLKEEYLQFTLEVSFEKRSLALNNLLSDMETKFYPFSINKLLATVNGNYEQSYEFVQKLEGLNAGSNPSGLSVIWKNYKVDNITEGSDNIPVNEIDSSLLGFTTILTNLLSTTNKFDYKEETMEFFLDNPSNVVKLESDLFSFKNADYAFNNNKVRFFGYTNVDYNEIIPVDVAGSFTIEGKSIEKGIPLFIPAYQAALYADMNDETVSNKAFWLTVNVGSCFLGLGSIGVLFRAGNYIQKGITAMDLIGSGLGIYAQIANEDAISPDLRNKINVSSALMSLPLLATSIPKLGRVVDDLDNLLDAKRISAENINQITDKCKNMATSLIPKMGNAGEYSEEFALNYADELLAINRINCDFTCKLQTFGCFVKGTSVQTKEGTQEISTLNVGDSVLSYNHKMNKKEVKYISAIKRQIVSAIMLLVMSTGDTLWATPDHPFFSDGVYVPAEELQAGAKLFSSEGSDIFLKERFVRDTSIEVFNLTVPGNENYFVGSGVLVHNTCFLKKLDDYPTLRANLNNLSDELKGKFIEDFAGVGDEVLEVLDGVNGVKAWERFLAGDPNGVLRLHPDWLSRLSLDLSHNTWGDEIAQFLDENPADVYDVWKKLKDDPAYHWELYDSEGFEVGSRWDKWSKREFFKSVTKKGKEFELACLNNMKTRTGPEYERLKQLVPDLDDRYLISQMQFCLPGLSPPCNNKGDFFIADQVWIKYDDEGDILDMVIVDSKLSIGTNFTPGQSAAKNNVGGKLDYKPNVTILEDELKQELPGGGIVQGTSIKMNKFYKLYGDGNKNYIGIE